MNEKEALFKKIDGSKTFRNICNTFGLRDKKVLDIGCGFGHYLRHFGRGSTGVTTSLLEVDFGKKNNLDIIFGNAEFLGETSLDTNFEAFWANNLFEHLLSPHAFLMNLKKISKDNAVVILGVPVVPLFPILLNLRWWRGPLASNHVNFFNSTTLRLTVEYAGWEVLEVRPFVFRNKFFDILIRPFAPHMYVVAKNKIDFKYPPKKIHEWESDKHYKDLLSITNQI
jgi:Cyclopropane fatty acid synthase and related methyltransferases